MPIRARSLSWWRQRTLQLMSDHARSVTAAKAHDLAIEILEIYASGDENEANRCGHEPGPVMLASLAHSAGLATTDLARQVALRWLDELPAQVYSLGAFGGLGGFIAGLRAGGRFDPQLSSLADGLVDEVHGWFDNTPLLTSLVAWRDYDLFNGPAGLLLAGAVRGACAGFTGAARHLALLCDQASLERLRAGTDIDPRSAFNVGRINTCLAHGVAGVVSALRHAVETLDDGDDYRPALGRACDWLLKEAYLADCGLITWPPVGHEGTPASYAVHDPQAWCYGTPGIAWTLWDAGRVLETSPLQILGEEAMLSFTRVFDADRFICRPSIAESLSICHGAAGTLAVADAFAHHVNLDKARLLRDYLEDYLLDRQDDVIELARKDMTMLNGAGGIMSVLLTADGGSRDWLPHLALR